MKNSTKYAICVDIECMIEQGINKEDIKSWFLTPCNNEEGYNGYIAEDIAAGKYSIEELAIAVDECMKKYF